MAGEEKLRFVLESIWRGAGVRGAKKDMTALGSEGKKASKSMAEFARSAAAGIAPVVALGVAMKKAYDLGEQGAAIDRLMGAGEALAASQGQSMTAIVSAMQRGAQGTISEMDAMAAANQALQLGVATTPAEFEELARSSIALGQAMGVGPVQAINDITKGIGRMSPLILDNLGIMTRGGKVFEDYAKSVGKPVKALTDAEKKMILLGEAAKSAGKLLDENGEVVLDLASDYEVLEARLEDLGNRFKLQLAEGLAPLIHGFSEAATLTLDFADALDVAGDRVVNTHQGMVRLEDGTMMSKAAFVEWTKTLGISTDLLAAANPRVHDYASALDAVGEAAGSSGEKLNNSITILGDFTEKAIGAALVSRTLQDAMADEFISDAELQRVQALASTFGVELPAELGRTVAAFNLLSEQGVDPATASTEELLGALLSVDKFTKDVHTIEYKILVQGGGPVGIPGSATITGAGTSSGGPSSRGKSNQLGFAHGGRLPGGGVVEVGERGPEFIINGVVVPAGMTRGLKRLGLDAGRGLLHGGSLSNLALMGLKQGDPVPARGIGSQSSTRSRGSNAPAPATAAEQRRTVAPIVKEATQQAAAAVAPIATAIKDEARQQAERVERAMSDLAQTNRVTNRLLASIDAKLDDQATNEGVGSAVGEAMEFSQGV